MTPVLATVGLSAGYAGQPVIHDLDLQVDSGEVVCLLGPNGVGKTTTLLAMSGELQPMTGRVVFEGCPDKAPLHKRAKRGMSFVTEERSVFKGLSARDNLRCGDVAEQGVVELFPELGRVMGTRGGLLSGGEQQMLTLGRALLRRPRLLLADELSLGLAPIIVERLLKAVRAAADDQGTGVLMVEQHVRKALKYADRVYVMRRGRIEMMLSAVEARARITEIEQTYLAGAAPPSEPPTGTPAGAVTGSRETDE